MLRVPKSKLGQFLFFATTQFISYFLFVANTRAYTHGDFFWTAITDLMWSGQNFICLKLIATDENAKTFWAGLGYSLGGTAGTLCSTWVTLRVFGH
jgi:hypothetical protein